MEINFWTSSSGQNPILKFVKRLPELDGKSIMDTILNLQQFGYMQMMKSGELQKLSGHDLYELRIRWQNKRYRILCGIKQSVCYLLNIFIKKRGKTPPKEIKTALKRWNNIDLSSVKKIIH